MLTVHTPAPKTTTADSIVSCSSIPSLTFIIEGVEFEIGANELGVRSGWLSLGCESLIQPLPRGLVGLGRVTLLTIKES